MEGETGPQQFNFAVEVPLRQPRPWERVPKSPHASHRRGRKLWKRFEPRPNKAPPVFRDPESEDSSHEHEELVSTPGRRPVKRLRNAPQLEEGAPMEARYTTTLRDKAPGTPKSGSLLRALIRISLTCGAF